MTTLRGIVPGVYGPPHPLVEMWILRPCPSDTFIVSTHAPKLDPAWLFLIAGIAILAAVIIIPAVDDLNDARWARDCAIAIEDHRLERLERYATYLQSLRRGDRAVIESLAATQLNRIPTDRDPLLIRSQAMLTSASVFPELEPDPLVFPARHKADSFLERLTTSDQSRIWLIGVAGVCLLIGLLPPALPSGCHTSQAPKRAAQV